MSAREDQIRCGDAWCDGDHTSYSERCEPDEPQLDLLEALATVLGVRREELSTEGETVSLNAPDHVDDVD